MRICGAKTTSKRQYIKHTITAHQVSKVSAVAFARPSGWWCGDLGLVGVVEDQLTVVGLANNRHSCLLGAFVDPVRKNLAELGFDDLDDRFVGLHRGVRSIQGIDDYGKPLRAVDADIATTKGVLTEEPTVITIEQLSQLLV
jgi:hypothetical protein